MQKLILALLLCSTSALADSWEDNGVPPDQWKNEGTHWAWYEPWRTQDTVRESIFLSLSALDLLQTHQIVEQHLREENPFLGTHPSMAKTNETILAGMLLHYEIARSLPQVPRSWFQYWFIFVEATAVKNNYGMGLLVKF